MGKKILKFFQRDNLLWLALFFFITAAFLRFYRFPEFVTFLGDQGRDAIVMKRILTFEHFPAIGAPTSVGQVYLGPFYYYFIAPWLFFSNFDPIGPAIGVAVFSSFFVLINYFLVKDLFGRKIALITSFFIAFSSVLIEFSRFSWNPNLLPLFTLVTVYATTKAVQTYKKIFYLIAGAFLAFSIQLHYLALFLALPIAVIFLWNLLEDKKNVKNSFSNTALSFVAFLFFSLPLFIFDLRHDFLNSKNFMKLFQASSSAQAQNKLGELLQTFFYLNNHVFQAQLNVFLLGVFLLGIVVLFFMNIKKNRNLSYVILFFLLSITGLSFYSGPKYPHYFGAVYPIYFIMVAYLLAFLMRSKILLTVLILFLASFLYLNSRGYYYFTERGSDQIPRAKKIAVVIQNSVTKPKFSVTALPNQYSDSTYRYFLEIWGKRPLEKDTLDPARELFVICEGTCKPIGNPQWDIAYFKPKKVEEIENILPSVTMYRLSN